MLTYMSRSSSALPSASSSGAAPWPSLMPVTPTSSPRSRLKRMSLCLDARLGVGEARARKRLLSALGTMLHRGVVCVDKMILQSQIASLIDRLAASETVRSRSSVHIRSESDDHRASL